MGSSVALKDLQRDRENKLNDLSKLQKGNYHKKKTVKLMIARQYINPYTDRWLMTLVLMVFFVCLLDIDIAKNHQVRKKYTIQLGENELVLKVHLFASNSSMTVFLCI